MSDNNSEEIDKIKQRLTNVDPNKKATEFTPVKRPNTNFPKAATMLPSNFSVFSEKSESRSSCEFRPCTDSPKWSQKNSEIDLKKNDQPSFTSEYEYKYKETSYVKGKTNYYSFTPNLRSIFFSKF